MAYCSKCGTQIDDSANFCPKCGNSIGEDIVNGTPLRNSDEMNKSPKSDFKKYLLYIIGGFILLMILGYCSSDETSYNNGDAQVANSTNVVNEKNNSEQEIQAKKVFLEKFYKEKNGREQDDEYAYIKKNVTANGLKNLKDLYDFECEGECLATWVFDYDEGSDIGDLLSSTITSQDENNFLVENKYEYAKYAVLLTVVKDGDVYKIDKIEQKESSYFPPEQEETANLDWLQGHWVYEQGNYKGHFIIQGNTITQYSSMNPEHYDATYRIKDDELKARLVDGLDLTVKIDFANQRIDYGDGQWMHKVDY